MEIDLQLLCWNLHGTPSAPRVLPRLRRAAAEILRRKPDVALLQEIWRPRDADFLVAQLRGRYRRVDPPAGALFGRRGGLIGLIARGSPFRVQSSSFEAFTTHAPRWKLWEGDGLGEKGILRIDLGTPGGPVVLLNTHLQAAYAPGGYTEIRRNQLRQLAAAAARIDPRIPVIVAGDLNTRPEEPIYDEVARAFRDLGEPLRQACGCGTVPGRSNWIDYVLLRRGKWSARSRIELIRSRRPDVPFSDHHGLDAEISLRRDEARTRPEKAHPHPRWLGASTRRQWLYTLARLARPGFFALAVSLLLAVGRLPVAAVDPNSAPGLGLHTLDTDSGRSPGRLLETPLSISVVEGDAVRNAGPGVEIEGAVEGVPGVFAQSSYNFAQDPRISIRGFGARSTFGVRGIRVLVDGVPNTLPDGQTELDSLEMAFVERIDIVRGPISSLYGGGGGGVVAIETAAPTPDPRGRSRTLFGSDSLFRQELLYTGTHAGTGVVAGLGFTRYSGYREHAHAQQTNLLTKFQRTLSDGTELGLSFSAVWAPEAQDPGGLDAAQVETNRQQAAPRNLRFDSGEELDQQKLALSLARPLPGNRGSLRAWAWTLWRDFSNKLPTEGLGQIDLERRVSGASIVVDYPWWRATWLFGVDVDFQRDRRRRYENLDGARGELGLDQSETVRTVGPFAQAEIHLGSGFGIVAGARYDWTEFVVDDDFLAGGDESGRIRFRELSPRLGLRYGQSPAFHAYANLLSGFQVPTTTQLAPASGIGGFDPDTDPERSLGFEIGAKGVLDDRFTYEIAIFSLEVDDVFVPFENSAGRTFFRNAGKTRRRGLESSSSVLLRPGLTLRTSYTFSDFVYRDYKRVDSVGSVSDFGGNREPNVPRQSFAGELRWEHPSGLRAVLSARYFSDLEVDDANSEESKGAMLSNLWIGYSWRQGDLEHQPFVGILNWSGVRYNGTIRPNAFGGRYFEPAPRTEVFGGWEIRWL